MNRSKLKNIAKSSFIYVITLTGVSLFISGCSTPKVLENRQNIPPATYAPPADANEIVSNAESSNADITIPMSPADEIVIAQDTLIQPSTEYPTFPEVKVETIKYKVKKGDSFWKIARMYGVGMKELAAYNNMDLKKHLLAGEVLDIPPGGKLLPEEERTPIKTNKAKAAPKAAKTTKTASSTDVAASENGFYTVKPGDSLWLIAKRNNTTVSKLCQANNISKSTPLKVGQKLALPDGSKAGSPSVKPVAIATTAPAAVPTKTNELSKADTDLLNELINTAPAASPAPSAQATESLSDNFLPHTVKEGDSWNTISEMYGVSIDALKKANPKLASENELKIGTVVNIPEE